MQGLLTNRLNKLILLESRAPIQWHLDRLEKWLDRDITKFNRGKCTVPDTNISWRSSSWKAAFSKRLGVPVDNKLTMMQYYSLAARRPTPSRATWASVARKSKSMILPFFLAPVRSHLGNVLSLGFPEQERHRHTGTSPGRGTRVVEGL